MLPLLVPTAAAFLTGPALRGIGVRAPVRVSAPVAYDYEVVHALTTETCLVSRVSPSKPGKHVRSVMVCSYLTPFHSGN